MPGVSFDGIADRYDATRGLPADLMGKLVDALVAVFEGSAPVVDVGVGTGRFALPLQERGLRVVGLDLAPRMLALAAEKGTRDVLLGDATRMPFRDAAFGGAISIHMLHLVPGWRDVLHEVARVTRGRFVTLLEAITTRPVDSGLASTVFGDALAFPMGRYHALAAERGYVYRYPGVRTPDLVTGVPPEIRVRVGSFSRTVPAEELLAPLAARTHSSQWNVPEDVHREVVATLRREIAGRSYERTREVELVGWRAESLLAF